MEETCCGLIVSIHSVLKGAIFPIFIPYRQSVLVMERKLSTYHRLVELVFELLVAVNRARATALVNRDRLTRLV